jgi:hypothetical protein
MITYLPWKVTLSRKLRAPYHQGSHCGTHVFALEQFESKRTAFQAFLRRLFLRAFLISVAEFLGPGFIPLGACQK